MANNIAIYGAGGLGREVACLIRQINEQEPKWNLIGFFDDTPSLREKQISHLGQCLGGIDELNAWKDDLAVALAIGDRKIVHKLYEKIKNPYVFFPNIVHPCYYLADQDTFSIGMGNIIQGGFSATCDVQIGDFNLFNGQVILGHNVEVGSFNAFMNNVMISGNVKIGEGNFFGVGSIVIEKKTIGNDVRLGAGSVLMTKPKDGCLYLGVPAFITEF